MTESRSFRLVASAVAGTVLFATAGMAAASANSIDDRMPTTPVALAPLKVLFDGLTPQTVNKYDQYVTTDKNGMFGTSIPDAVALLDGPGTAAVRSAVNQANALLRAQQGKQTGEALPGNPLSYETEHGGISVDWTGVTVWLDGDATAALDSLLALGATAQQVLDFLSSNGIALPPGAGPVAGAVAAAVLALKDRLEECKGTDGFTLKVTVTGQVTCTPRN
ncbi:hypothetical protein [Luteipulveratus mongoliensis]|uniref:Uncharacterized protein n=1 Tax=Luteipulveratus mongoliensis TaxID=571913 RepID=A0A0K1JF60_9MICO|nr:hypothetical protein [Luteipulveratus mongoliensis]AKU15341.1 hypothetical protein VV02_04795 [Luteipulveratus mongoliensis]